jgi:hypothetical protein
VLAAVGCSGSAPPDDAGTPTAAPAPPADPVPLVDIVAFREADPDLDPFRDMAPDPRICESPSFLIEEDSVGSRILEVRTDVCNYITLSQPALEPIKRGDEIHLLLWHNTLGLDAPAVGYAALQLGDQLAWSVEVPIPSEAASYSPVFDAPGDLPAGSLVYLHVHNHGANSWRFGELTVRSRH